MGLFPLSAAEYFLRTILLSGTVLFGVLAAGAQAESLVYEGKGLDSITLGESTETDVIAAYGTDYKLLKHSEYSYQLIYRNAGLSFYYCAADPKREIFVIQIEEPARAVTTKGIRLGISRMGDVFEKYGESRETSNAYEYEEAGIYFDTKRESKHDGKEDARTPVKEPVIASEGAPQTSSRTVQVELSSPIEVNDDTTMSSKAAEFFVPKEPVDEAREKAEKEAELKQLAQETVWRIEIIERSGLRQCDTKFPPKR